MFITKEYLKKLSACVEAQEWFESMYPNGCKLSVEALITIPHDEWVWWFGCRLYPDLVWVAVNIAFREAARVVPELQSWVGEVNHANWQQARAAAVRAARAAGTIAATDAARAAGYAATDAAGATARAARAAADAAAAAAICNELKEAAMEMLLNVM